MSNDALNLNQIQQQLDLLNEGEQQEWAIEAGKLHRQYSFSNFVEAFGFMTRAAIHSEKINHHPEWSNIYKTVDVNLVTHDAGGITELDFKLAKIMNKLASD